MIVLTREQLIESFRQEVKVIKHLYSKVQPKDLDYRPSPVQRSLQELLDFIPCNAAAVLKHVMSGEWTSSAGTFDGVKRSARKDFLATLDHEVELLVVMIKSIPDDHFQNKDVIIPPGITMKLGPALIAFNLKFFTAYRMQLFLYLKATGHTELGTPNLWMGADMPKRPQA